MAKKSITHHTCWRCKQPKPMAEFLSEFAYRQLCADCRNVSPSPNNNPYYEVTCHECGKVSPKRSDVMFRWSGLCRNCNARRKWNDPELLRQSVAKANKTKSEWSEEKKAQFAERSRQQVLRQGGVPNAVKFCRSGEEGRDVTGERNYQWLGYLAGLGKKARIIDMGRNRYRTWRKTVFERDDYTCQFCGQRGGKLEADHILPYSTHVELRYEVSNGRTLCKPCHRTTETYGARALRFKLAS